MKIKVCCSTYWYPYFNGDIHATYVHDINRFLIKNGCEVFVITPNYGNSSSEEEYDKVKIKRFDFKVPLQLEYGKVAQTKKNIFQKLQNGIYIFLYSVLNVYNTYKICKKEKIDVLHAHWAIPSGLSAVIVYKLLKIPCVITMHGGDVYYNPSEGYDYPKLWYVKPFLKYTLDNASILTAITNDCKKHALNAGAKDTKTVIVFNGTDTERFRRIEKNKSIEEIKKKYNIHKHSIFVCRQLIPRKGVRYAINAMSEIVKNYHDCRMLIAGDGFERNELELLIKKLNLEQNVFLIGWVDNKQLPYFYNSCMISVRPSLEEGFGIPAVESLACEKPVVATDAGGLPEVISDGYTGFIVKKGDSLAIANACLKLFNDVNLVKEFGRNGREITLKKYSWDNTAKQFIQLYEGLIWQLL